MESRGSYLLCQVIIIDYKGIITENAKEVNYVIRAIK
jgi:hypothetical protein